MRAVSVRVTTTPRLLAELLAATLVDPELRPWCPDEGPPQVTIRDAGGPVAEDGHVVIELGARIDEPLRVWVDGVSSTRSISGPSQLRDLVIDLTHEISSERRR